MVSTVVLNGSEGVQRNMLELVPTEPPTCIPAIAESLACHTAIRSHCYFKSEPKAFSSTKNVITSLDMDLVTL
jgi:hypothetical protein